ncbi:MAG TPA: hypothetical protein VFG84_01030 [Gemmatimonadaceae bacterium]|nr:hypothetical protein [Gemmatimonadaceae bacterium]
MSNVRAVVHVPDSRRGDSGIVGAVVIGALVGVGVAWLLRGGIGSARTIEPLDAIRRELRSLRRIVRRQRRAFDF